MSPSLEISDAEAIEELARTNTVRNLQRVAILVTAVALIGIPLDPFFREDLAGGLGPLVPMRLGHALAGAAAFLALLSGPVARRPLVAGVGLAALGGGSLGAVAGLLGNLEGPWFHSAHSSFLWVFVVSAAPPWRALCCFALPVSMVVGLVLVRPAALPASAPALSFPFMVAAVGAAIGHVLDRATRRSFLVARARENASREIEALNATLEDRVRAQTRELRMLAAHLESTRDDERARIARELHDELGQELTALRYALTYLRQRYERDPASVRANLDELEALLARAAATTRSIVSDLRPRILDDLGLLAGVEWLVRRTGERTGLDCRLSTTAQLGQLDVEVSNAAFRIVQESLTNAAKHAQASRVDVEIDARDGELRLTVRDDGVGLPEPPEEGRGGMGLLGMRERARALGGDLHLESAPGRGTAVRVRLPIEEVRA